jgi:hypothetical protein
LSGTGGRCDGKGREEGGGEGIGFGEKGRPTEVVGGNGCGGKGSSGWGFAKVKRSGRGGARVSAAKFREKSAKIGVGRTADRRAGKKGREVKLGRVTDVGARLGRGGKESWVLRMFLIVGGFNVLGG